MRVQEKTFKQPQDVAGRDARRVPTIIKTGLDGDEIEEKERSILSALMCGAKISNLPVRRGQGPTTINTKFQNEEKETVQLLHLFS